MRCPFGLGFFVWLVPACALSFEPLGLSGQDGSPGSGEVGVSADATISDSQVPDGGDPDFDGSSDDLGWPPDRGVGRPDAGPRVSVTLIATGSNDAWFHSEPPGLDCQGTGNFEVEIHSSWSVTAEPTADRVFKAWTQGPCATSTTSVCRFTVDESVTLKANYDRL